MTTKKPAKTLLVSGMRFKPRNDHDGWTTWYRRGVVLTRGPRGSWSATWLFRNTHCSGCASPEAALEMLQNKEVAREVKRHKDELKGIQRVLGKI